MNKTLLIDLGSTSIKWMVIDASSKASNKDQVPFPSPCYASKHRYEVDSDAIMAILMSIIERFSDIQAIMIAVQMHGYLLSDQAGVPITPYISWRDHRALGVSMPFVVDSKTGTSMKANLPKAGLHTIKTHQKEVWRQAKRFFTLGSYVAFRLTGFNATHISDAAPTGFYSVLTGEAEPFDLELPQARWDLSVIGTYRGIKVYAPIGDQQASVYGADPDDDTYVYNIGTAAQLSCLAQGFVKGDFESRPYVRDQTLCTVTGLTGGACLHKEPIHEEQVRHMVFELKEAIKRLPSKDQIMVIGGALRYHKDLIRRVLDEVGLPFSLDGDTDALSGLKKLIKDVDV